MKNKILKMVYIILSVFLVIPSIIYLIQNKTVMGFNTYYNFFINTNSNKIVSTLIYLAIYMTIIIMYLIIIKKKDIFKNIKQILIFTTIIGVIFIVMLPWTSSDIFYYMGVGELDGIYHQNPYYVTMKEYYNQNQQDINDEILEQGANNFWAKTTVVYGPIAQLIFKTCSSISLKNIDISLFIYKIVNLIIHIANCYLIYKLTNKKIFSIIYGLNPYILLEFIGNVHNDIIVVFFVLISLYFIIKKKNILLSIIFLALATGIKYYTILLLPVIVLYHFKNEEKLWKRILRCIQYGIIFIAIFGLEYVIYFKDINILFAMLPQTDRYSKSIYSALSQININLMQIIRGSMITCFIYFVITYCFDFLIFPKDNKITQMLRKYNIILMLFILILTNCHQWYLIWLFATIMWQKPNMIRNIIGVSAITEIANTIYMFKVESYIYDLYYVGIITVLSIMWIIANQKSHQKLDN